MASALEICNAALERLNQEPITSFEDGTKFADICLHNWPLKRDEVLRSYEFPCAVRRATLSPLADVPDWGYSYQFQKPADCLRLLETSEDTDDYRVEGDRILCDSATLSIRYIARVEDGYLDSMLIEALIAAMIKVLAYPATASASMAQVAAQDFRESAQEAKSKTKTEKQQPETDDMDTWLTARQ